MTFEQALSAMKERKSVRQTFDRFGNTRYYIAASGLIVRHGDSPKQDDVIVDQDCFFGSDQLLAEDWEVIEKPKTEAVRGTRRGRKRKT